MPRTLSVRAPARGARSRVPLPAHVAPMLATLAGELPQAPGDYTFEWKWDGVRALTYWDGKRLRLGGQGPGGGDLYLRIKIEPHLYFRREGKDVVVEVPLSLAEAVLGAKVDVHTLEGSTATVKIPPGTSSGARLRLRGKGIAGGDEYIEIKVAVPAAADDKSRELIEEFARRNPQDPRRNVPWA